MKINNLGLQLIKDSEGLQLKAYRCPANILTIGYGHTGSDVTEGLEITKEKAEDLLKKDLEKFESGVQASLSNFATENQFSAMISLTYNIGLGNFKASTLLKLFNNNDKLGASEQFLRWNKGGGKILPGLTIRRQKEKELFLKA